MAFSQGFGKMQADSRRNASRGQPFSCPLLCGLSAAYRGEAKKIPYPVSFGIRHFEKGVNERGESALPADLCQYEQAYIAYHCQDHQDGQYPFGVLVVGDIGKSQRTNGDAQEGGQDIG